jgi:hypothetical protein
MRPALVTVALVAWFASAAAAQAAETTVIDPRRDVRAKGVNDQERYALDIARVNATGGRFGLIVDVMFGGDTDALLGKGRLRDATVTVVLHRRAGALTVSTRGPDAAERSGRDVIRRRETFQFFALGVSGVQRIEARVMVGRRIVDRASVRRPSGAGCADLAWRIDDLRDELGFALGSPDLARIEGVRERVIDAWRELDCRQEMVVLSSGYEHRPGAIAVCADARPFPDLGDPLAFALYSYDAKVVEGTADVRHVQSTVTAEGRYRFEIFKVGEPEIATSVELDVVAPPPALTKACS